jgi:glycosyltransferase involved in cell wall biosynthesis
MHYHILIPAYNAADTIGVLLDQIAELRYQPDSVIVIDDGSVDKTAAIARHHQTVLLQLKRNYGKGYALQQGIAYFLEKRASNFLLTMDADLQHPVQSIPDFLSLAEHTHVDLIIGKRKISLASMPLHRVLSNKITSWILSRITDLNIPDSQCGFRLMHINFLDELKLNENGFQAESEMILKAARLKKKIGFVSIPTIYRSGKSNIKHCADTLRFIRLIMRIVVKKW